MTLGNEPIAPDRLPGAEALAFDPVSGHYPVYRVVILTLRWVTAGLVLAVASAAETPREPIMALWPVLFGSFALVHLACAWREARMRGWALREHDLIYRSGLFTRRTMVLPFNRIQHVETLSGPLERAFGLLRVICYTAGGLSADLVVAGLQQSDAERVRQFLLGRIADDEPVMIEPGVQDTHGS